MANFMKKRLAKLRQMMAEKAFDCFLVFNAKNVFYLTGFSEGLLVLPGTGEPQLLVSPLSADEARERSKGCEIVDLKPGEKALERALGQIDALKAKRAYFDSLDYAGAQPFREKLGTVELESGAEHLWSLRRVKDTEEVEKIRGACKLASLGMKAVGELLRPGVEERLLAAEAEYEMRRRGSEGTPFRTIVASGPRGAMPHAAASGKVIQSGEVVVVDLGASFEGYDSDVTRTFAVGGATGKALELLSLVQEAQTRALEALKAGLPCKEADSLARDLIAKAGYGERFIHSLGHGVGLEVHEPPSLSQQSSEVLEEGNVVTVEPGVYIRGFGGFRVEDTVLIAREKVENLTFDP